jgi:hypothetical protein
MRRVSLILLLAGVMAWPWVAQASQEVLPGESERDFALDNKYSIGLDNVPWNATRASFRIWKDEGRGMEISIGKVDFASEQQGEFVTYRYIKLEPIRFDWLRRSQPMSIEGLFLVHGYGVGLSGDASEHEDDRSGDDYYRDAYRLRQRARIYLYLYLPLGVEYFFWERYPNVSFSVQADFYCRFGYGYDFEYSRYAYTDEYENNSGYFTLGLDPAFYFRFYFK